MIRILVMASLALMMTTGSAAADPISAIITAVAGAFKGAAIVKALLQVALSVGLSLIQQKLAKRGQKEPGLQNQFKGRGGSEPETAVLGRAAVTGHQVYHNSSGNNNRYYHDVIELCGLPGATLLRLIIDGEYSDLGEAHADFGPRIETKVNEGGTYRSWIKYYDGTHVAADPMMVARYGADEERPWTSDHILGGIGHVIHTSDYDRKVFRNGVAEMRFEMLGPPMYDPRQDSTVGGSGPQRWDTPSTWAQTENLVVLIYNIMRGIALPDGNIWGGDCAFEDLPIDNWVAAMNACDVEVDGRAKYRGGIEVDFTQGPEQYVQELKDGCGGQMSELGGVWRIQVDAAATAVVHLTDDDFLVSSPSRQDPYPGLEATFNGITVVHPDPEALWNGRPALTITNAAWEAEDGARRIYDLKLPAVPYPEQAKQLANAMLNDNRRFRRHKGSLPPEYFHLNALQTLSWTSEYFGYSAHLFEIAEIAYDLFTFNTQISIRERDPADFAPDLSLELPSPVFPTGPFNQSDAGVPGFAVSGVALRQSGAEVLEAGLHFTWNGDDLENLAQAIAWQIRINSAPTATYAGTFQDIAAGELKVPTLRGTAYEARMRVISDTRDTQWEPWTAATTPGQRDPNRFDNMVFNPYFADGQSDGWTITDTPAEDFASDVIARADFGASSIPGQCPFDHMVRFQFGNSGNSYAYNPQSDPTAGTYPFAALKEKTYLSWSSLLSVTPGETVTFEIFYAGDSTPISVFDILARLEFFDTNQNPIATTQNASVALLDPTPDQGIWQRRMARFETPASCVFVGVRLSVLSQAVGIGYLSGLRFSRSIGTERIARNAMTEALAAKGTNLVPTTNNTFEDVLSAVFDPELIPGNNASGEDVTVAINVTGFYVGTAFTEFFLTVNGLNAVGFNSSQASALALSDQVELSSSGIHDIALSMRTDNIANANLLDARISVVGLKA